MEGFEKNSFDVVLSLGVIEHVPHTPRLLMNAIDYVLKPEGILILDTPNLAYIYKRRQLSNGISPYVPIGLQYETEIPFEGHHREYTLSEIRWIIGRIGYKEIYYERFNQSYYGLEYLSGDDLELYNEMLADETAREIILMVARK